MKLGKLKSVGLRSFWQHEALHFTKWLSEPEHIAMLSDEVGVEIEVTQVEASVGRYNVDILGKEENSNRKIIIENQLESANHDHLGKLITYAAGHEASFIIWVVRDVKEEHRQAIDWLNEHTDEDTNFFLVTIELWQIGDSEPAPKFNVVCRPNQWQRTVRTSLQSGEVSDTKTRQLEFWGQLKTYANDNYPQLKLRTPKPKHWFDVSIGRADCHVCLIVDSQKNHVRCELYIPNSKELFKSLHEAKTKIEQELGVPESLSWQDLGGKKARRISMSKNFDFDNEATWKDAIKWLIQNTIKFKQVFSKKWGGE